MAKDQQMITAFMELNVEGGDSCGPHAKSNSLNYEHGISRSICNNHHHHINKCQWLQQSTPSQ